MSTFVYPLLLQANQELSLTKAEQDAWEALQSMCIDAFCMQSFPEEKLAAQFKEVSHALQSAKEECCRHWSLARKCKESAK